MNPVKNFARTNADIFEHRQCRHVMQRFNLVRDSQSNDFVRAQHIRGTVILVGLNGVHRCAVVVHDVNVTTQCFKSLL
jgi:hypothetical protein